MPYRSRHGNGLAVSFLLAIARRESQIAARSRVVSVRPNRHWRHRAHQPSGKCQWHRRGATDQYRWARRSLSRNDQLPATSFRAVCPMHFIRLPVGKRIEAVSFRRMIPSGYRQNSRCGLLCSCGRKVRLTFSSASRPAYLPRHLCRALSGKRIIQPWQ
jgi:hypothetical protein